MLHYVGIRHDLFTIATSVSYFLHFLYQIFEILYRLLHLATLFILTEEDKLRFPLPSSTLHLDECLYIQHLVDAYNQITSGYIKTFFDDRGGNENIDFVVPKILNVLHEIRVSHLDLAEIRQILLQQIKFLIYWHFLSRLVSFVSHAFALEADCIAASEFGSSV